MNEWLGIAITTLGAAVAAVGAYLAARATSKVSGQAAKDATAVDDRRQQVEGFEALLEWQTKRMDTLETRIEQLAADLESERAWRGQAVRYIRDLLRLLHLHAPHVDVPDPPVELDLTISYRPRTDPDNGGE